MATVHMVDASPYIFRAHFSLPSSIKTPDGRPAAASYGFASFLLKLIADEKPTHLAVAFDRNLNGSFRNEIYPAYKEQRVAPPPSWRRRSTPAWRSRRRSARLPSSTTAMRRTT